MKKIIILIVTAFSFFLLASCGSKDEEGLQPIADYFEINTSVYVNVAIAVLTIGIVGLFVVFLSRRFKKNIYQSIKLGQLSKGWLWVMPESFKVFFLITFVYAGCVGLGVLGVAAYIEKGNLFIFLLAIILMFVGMILPSLITFVEGKTNVIFLGGKSANIFPQY